MAHVQFRTGEATTNGRIAQLVVDGIDITDHVLSDGFAIMPGGGGPEGEWIVQVRIAAHLDVDLPSALIKAMPAEDAA